VIKASYADESIPDQTQKIRRDGKVSLPLIGEVTAAGKRVIDFQHELVRRYEGQLESNEVLVTLENGTATVTVAGFANKPGAYPFDRPTTVYQAVMQAGGVSDYGSPSNIHLTRVIGGAQLTETVNLRPAIRGQALRPEYVQDGDVIYIGRSWFWFEVPGRRDVPTHVILPCRIHQPPKHVDSFTLALLFAASVIAPIQVIGQETSASPFEAAGIGWLPAIPIQITAGVDMGYDDNATLTPGGEGSLFAG